MHTAAYLLALLDLDLEKFVYCFLIVERIHDGQIDDPAEVDEVGLRSILNTLLFCHSCRMVSTR